MPASLLPLALVALRHWQHSGTLEAVTELSPPCAVQDQERTWKDRILNLDHHEFSRWG
jgi:hypothetical protein